MKPLSHYIRKLADRLRRTELKLASFLEQKVPPAAEGVSEEGR